MDETHIEGWESIDFSIRKNIRTGRQIAELILSAYWHRYPQSADTMDGLSRAQAAYDFTHLCKECIRQLQRGLEWDDYTIHIENLLEGFKPLCERLAIEHPPLTLEKRRKDGARIAYLYWPFKTALGGRREKATLIARAGLTEESIMGLRNHSFDHVLENFTS